MPMIPAGPEILDEVSSPAIQQGGGNAGIQGPHRPAAPDAPQAPAAEGSEHSEGEAARAFADENPNQAPSATHSIEDYERLFHEAAQSNQNEEQNGDDAQVDEDQVKALKQEVLQVLHAVKAQAPVLEQLSQQAPDAYSAVVECIQTMTGLYRQLANQGGTTDHTKAGKQENPMKKSDEDHAEDFDWHQARYWWLNDHHRGSGSDEYRELSESPYQPGAMENGVSNNEMAVMHYNEMCHAAGCNHEEQHPPEPDPHVPAGANATGMQAPKPLMNSEGKMAKNTPEFLYHGTKPEHRDSIAEHGLKPNQGLRGSGVWFTDNLNEAKDYGGLVFRTPFPEGNVLRTDESDNPEATYYRYRLGAYHPADLETLNDDGTWGPLQKSGMVAPEMEHKPLTKASIGRTLQHTQKNQFGIVTSWKGNKVTPEENRTSYEKLRHQLRSMGYGFFGLSGHWKDDAGNVRSEPSLFVPGLTAAHAQKIGRAYGQEAVIHGTPDQVSLHSFRPDGSVAIESIGDFHPQKLAEVYSKVKGKAFTFSGFDQLPETFMEAMLARAKDRPERDADMAAHPPIKKHAKG